jgi:hypothetical protein
MGWEVRVVNEDWVHYTVMSGDAEKPPRTDDATTH